MASTFYTIGHSNRSAEDFIALLQAAGARGVADVRAFPHSPSMPRFEGEALAAQLPQHGLTYRHFPALGGRRPHSPGIDPQLNARWDNRSFHQYADYATTAPFRAGLAELMDWHAGAPAALMCAEAVWWRCHRRILTDYLLAAGCAVFHVLGPGAVKPAQATPGIVTRDDGALTYPRAAGDAP